MTMIVQQKEDISFGLTEKERIIWSNKKKTRVTA